MTRFCGSASLSHPITLLPSIFKYDGYDSASAEAIVNTANHESMIGRGTDSIIYKSAGREQLLEERKKIGVIERGHSACTPSFKLKKNGVKYIIHTVGIRYRDGTNGETDILRSCYRTSLQIAAEKNCKSVALPLLASGYFGFPKEIAIQIAVEEISRFLLENELDVFLLINVDIILDDHGEKCFATE